jgi:hypothetical protein
VALSRTVLVREKMQEAAGDGIPIDLNQKNGLGTPHAFVAL